MVALRRMTYLGRTGIVFLVLFGLGFVTAQVLFLLALVEVAELIELLSLVPALLAVVFLGAEMFRNAPGSGGGSVSPSMGYISQIHH